MQIAIALTQLLNALTGGYAGEAFSARCYRAWRDGLLPGRFLKPLIDGIFFRQTDHCRNSYLNTLERRHLPPEYRQPEGPRHA